jgi:integrase
VTGRRMNGEGSVYQRTSDGRWVGAVTVGYTATGTMRRKTVTAKTKSEVLTKMRAVRRNLDDGLPTPDDRLTVGQVLDRWMNDVLRHQVAPIAFENYKSVADLHIRPTLGKRQVTKLVPADVDALMSAKLDAGYSVSTVRRIRAILVQALNQAERWGLVVRNVAAVTRGPRAKRTEGRTLTPSQARQLLASLSGHRLETLYVTMLGLGLRRGEALGLAWADVSLDRGVLVIRHALKREGGTLVLGEVKTAKSRRSLNIPRPVVESLKAHRARQAQDRLAVGEAWTDSGLVFTTQVGTPLDPRNIYRDFVGVCERSGLGRWHPHELRHSAASIMLAQGVPIEVVSDILGHSSIRMTADVYGHILEPQRAAAADAMAKALWSNPGDDARTS